MSMEKDAPRVERPKLIIPHQEGTIAFAYPAVGPVIYTDAARAFIEEAIYHPTGEEIASLIHAAYCHEATIKEPEFGRVREIIKNHWLWVFNRNLFAENGVYVFQDDDGEGIGQPLDEKDLEKMLQNGFEVDNVRFSADNRIRFAPRETYSFGDKRPDQLARDGFMIASFGPEGAGKIAEASSMFTYIPRVLGMDFREDPSKPQRVTAIRNDSDGLTILGENLDGKMQGYCYGVIADY